MAAYTTIDDPSAFFQATTYTGNGGNGHVITHTGNSNLQADMVWVKMRNAAYPPVVYDTNRRPSGTPFSGSLYMFSIGNNYGTGAENTGAYGPTAIGSNSVTMNSYDTINLNNKTFVSWNWKANGGTTASNSDGSVTSTVQVNQDAGFSIATATAPSSNGHWSFGHGLGVKPDMVITRQRTGGGWWTWHKDLTNQTTYYLGLNTTSSQTNEASMWGGGMTSSVIGVSSPNSTLASEPYVAYCFAEKQGYSKFGKYVGNGSPAGPFIYTGFKPAFVMTKRTDSTGNWIITDLKRSGYNGGNKELFADLDQAEDSDSRYDLLSNGFKIRVNYATSNASSGSYIYMAFAENPFVTSTGTPATAR